ncbi:DUF123 domain-containing protein [Melioribacteraceae bacterium 4301-Me]|uniref:GIY-YIG nuclease family protein n=1 Tax=Pyranulibacter aquaticus TaxID=3163344 RepID=UPI00359717CF
MVLLHGLKKELKKINIFRGTYLLEIKAFSDFSIDSKMFKGNLFPKGYYYYSGSAQVNFQKRIERHLRKTKNIFWHIDYITSLRTNKILTVFIFDGKEKDFECKLVSDLQKNFSLRHVAKKFGSGDCSTCYSHLLYSKTKINHNHFISLYHPTVRFIPSSSEML